MAKYYLSPSTLNIFRDCPRCFWLHIKRGIKRPRGLFPSLPGGMDLVIKAYFDSYRLKNELPPEIKNNVIGKLYPDISVLEKWRNWKNTDLQYEDKVLDATLSGALDDCLVNESFYIPIDFKTKGSELIEDPRKYYQMQLDCYCLILESSGYKTKGLAYLIYFWPMQAMENGMIKFKVSPIKIETNIESGKKIFNDAVACLSTNMPKASTSCEYCSLVVKRKTES